MYVHHGLPGGLPVVLEDVESIARKSAFEVCGDLLDACGEECERIVGRVEKVGAVFLGDHEGVSFGEWIDVQIGEHEFVFVDLEGWDFPCGDGAEYAIVFHAPDYSIYGRMRLFRFFASADFGASVRSVV